MARGKIRVGIIGANVRYGWGRDAHIPALSALPEFEITAVSTSRRETAEETAKHFGIPHAFADPYKMVQHPDVDLVSICVRVPFHHELGMASLDAGKHFYCEWPLAATTEQAQHMRDLASAKGGPPYRGTTSQRGPRVQSRQRPGRRGLRIKIVETGETIQMTAPDQVLISGVLQSGAVASVHLKGGTSNGTAFLFATYIEVSEFTVRGAQAGKLMAMRRKRVS